VLETISRNKASEEQQYIFIAQSFKNEYKKSSDKRIVPRA
jgi:hypothetical protein